MDRVTTSRNCLLFCRFLKIILILGGLCVALPKTAHAVTYTVSKTADTNDGTCGADCSLREAITASNAAGTGNTIAFNIPGDTDGGCTGLNGICTISPGSALPNITQASTTVDGYTQAGSSVNTTNFPNALDMVIRIRIDGASAGATVNGLHVNNVGSVVIKGVAITNFNNVGIRVTGASASNTKIQGNYIGVQADGETAGGMTNNGVYIAGGTGTKIGVDGDGANEARERNLISSSTSYQVEVCNGCSSTVIAGNFIGTDKDGDTDLTSAAATGIRWYSQQTFGTNGDGVSDAIEGNLVGGQANAIAISGANSTVAGNYVGLNSAGTGSVANSNTGINVGAANAIVGTNADGTSDALERNYVANSGVGVYIASTGAVVTGNYIGLNAAGTAGIGNTHGVGINSTGARIGTNGDGTNDSVEGNVISGNGNNGIYFYDSGDTGAVIAGNIIGLNAAGTAAVPNDTNNNGSAGIYVTSGSNRIGTNGDGTADTAERNVISGNTQYGIYMTGSITGNVIAGNYIGVGGNGTSDLGNGSHGIVAVSGASDTTIGGDISAEANVIAYNGDASMEYGVLVQSAGSDGNDILRNSFFSNEGIGIKLNADGANNDQATPTISANTALGEATVTISGTSTASAVIQLFDADSGNQEGQTWLGQATADGSGNWSIALTDQTYLTVGNVMVATATDATNGSSQFSSSYALSNNAPVASAQTVTATEDVNSTVTLGLTDPDGGTLTTTIVTLPASGALYQTADGTTLGAAITSALTNVTDSSRRVIYVPSANANGNGVGNFTFKGNDGLSDSNTATVTVDITPSADPPAAAAQTVSLNEDATRAITLTGSDVDGDLVTYAVVSNPAHGTLSGFTPGIGTATITYTPTANYSGADSFTFRVFDGSAYSSSATVTLNIASVNDAPTANAVSATVNQPTVTVTFSAADPENNSLRYAVVSNPSHGSLSGLNATAGTVTYTPTSGYRGTDTFTYKANDGTADSNSAVVTLTVEQVSTNHAPAVFAGSDLVAVEGSPVTLIGSATDEDGDSLTCQWTQGAGISVSLTNADRSWISFTAPTPDGSGDLEFVLTVSDGTDTATDSVRVKVSRRNFTMESAVKLTGRVVAAGAGMAITSEEGVRYDGHSATAVDLGHGSVLYSTDSTPVEVVTLGDNVVVGDSAHNDNAGVVVMVDTASLSRGAEIDLNDPRFTNTEGVIASYGDQKGDLFGYVVRTADIDGDGSGEILSLAPGTSNGTLYVLNGDDLETRNMILGSETEGLQTSLLFTTDLNGEGSDDLLIGLPSSPLSDLTSDDGALLASVTSSAAVLGGILGGSDLPTVIDLATVDTDFLVTASGDVSDASGGDLDASGSEDIVMSADGTLSVDVIFGSSSVGTDVATLSSGNRLTTDDASLSSPDSMAVDDVTGDGFADIVLGFSTADGGNGKILVVPGRGNWDADAYDLDNAITVNGADGDGIGEWLILEDYDGDGVVDIYTNRGSDSSYLITLGKLIDEASGGGTGNEADGEGGSSLGPGGFSGCSLERGASAPDWGWVVLFVGLFGGLSLFLLPQFMSPSTSKSPLTPLFQRGGKEIVLLSLLLFLSSCGGSSSGGNGTDTDEGGAGGEAPTSDAVYITLTGRITSPAVSTSVSALSKGKVKIQETASSGVRCSLYDLNGDYLGAVTTNESGDFVTTVGLSATEEDPTGRVVVSCENGIENYAEASLSEADLTEGRIVVDMDFADVSSTLATVSLITDFEEWGDDYSAEVSGRDLGCLFQVNRAVWDEADDAEEGLSDDIAAPKKVLEGFLAGGGEPEDAGYDDWPSLLHDVINGEAEGGPWEALIDTASTVDSGVGEYTGLNVETAEVFQAVAGTVSEQIDALYEEAGTTGDTTTSEVCGDIKDGDIDPAAFVGPILASETTAELTTVFNNPDGMLLHFNLLKQCKGAGTCDEMKEKPAVFFGFMAGFSGDYSAARGSSGFDSDVVEGMFEIAESCTGGSADSLKACGRGMHVTVYQGDDGWTAFKGGDGRFDPNQFVAWGGYWTNAGFDPNAPQQNFIDAFDDIRGEIWAATLVKRGLLSIGDRNSPVNIGSGTYALAYDSALSDLAGMWMANTLYLGSDDAFPSLGSSVYTGQSSGTGGLKLIVPATIDSSWLSTIKPAWSVTNDHVTTLEAHPQGYLITMNSAGNILILGGSAVGTQYGVTDFLKNLSTHTTSSASWTSLSVINWPDSTVRGSLYYPYNSLYGHIEAAFATTDHFSTMAACDYTPSCSTTAYRGIGEWTDALVKNKSTMTILYGSHYGYLKGNDLFKRNLTEMNDYLAARGVTVLPTIKIGDYDTGLYNPVPDLFEGLGVLDAPMTVSGGVLVPKASYYNGFYDSTTQEPQSILPFDDFSSAGEDTFAEVSCQGKNLYTDLCLYWGDYTGIALSSGSLVVPPGKGIDIFFGSPNTATASWLVRPDHYYVFGFRVKYDTATTASVGVSWWPTATNDYTVNATAGMTISGSWQWRSVVFRVPGVEGGAVDPTQYVSKFVTITNNGGAGAGNLILDDFRLYELDPLLQNVLANQDVTITDSADYVYTEGVDFTVNYGTLPTASDLTDLAKTIFDSNGDIKGSRAVISWIRPGAPPATLYVTYSSLLPSFQGAPFRYDWTQDDYYGEIVEPMAEDNVNLYGSLPPWAYLLGMTEMQRYRTGTSAGQTTRTNAQYAGYLLGRISDYLDGKRGGVAAKLRPLVWSDMFTTLHNGYATMPFRVSGHVGETAPALESLRGNPVVMTWNYSRCFAASHAMYRDFRDRGHNIIGVTSLDDDGPANAEDWAALAAGDPAVDLGIMDTNWSDTDQGAIISHMTTTFNLGWNAGWGLLRFFDISSTDKSAGEWSAGSSALSSTNYDNCDSSAFHRTRSGVLLAADWRSPQITLRDKWGEALKIRFSSKGVSSGINAPTVTMRFFDGMGGLLATSSGVSTHTRGGSIVTLTTSYAMFETGLVAIPAGAVVVEFNIVPAGASNTYLDDVLLLQQTAQPQFP